MIVEGDFGMGKTELLNNFVLNILPGKCTILSSSGNPFSRSQPFVAWIDIVTQYLVKFQVRGLGVVCMDVELCMFACV
jgi:hypothetical protein